MDFYNIYIKLCKEIGKTPSRVAVEAGFSKATVNRWKNGGGCTDANLVALSDYFTKELGRSITVEFLKGDDSQTVDDLAASVPLALYDGAEEQELPDDIKNMAAAFALAIQQQKKPERPIPPELKEAREILDKLDRDDKEKLNAALLVLRGLLNK